MSHLVNSNQPIDFQRWREEILATHKAAPTEEERVVCIKLMNALLDLVERNTADPQVLEKLRATRTSQQRLRNGLEQELHVLQLRPSFIQPVSSQRRQTGSLRGG
jgi:hypothetical protein